MIAELIEEEVLDRKYLSTIRQLEIVLQGGGVFDHESSMFYFVAECGCGCGDHHMFTTQNVEHVVESQTALRLVDKILAMESKLERLKNAWHCKLTDSYYDDVEEVASGTVD